MKNTIIILLKVFSLIFLFILASMTYNAIFFPSKKEKEVINRVSVDTVSCLRKKQIEEFSKLIKKIKESPYAFRIIKGKVSLCDSISIKRPATIEQLMKWTSFDFIVLTFPEGWVNITGILSINCDNSNKKNPEFFAKITTNSFSVPYYMAKTGKEWVSRLEEQKYVLESIELAFYSLEATVACNRIASTLIKMEKEEELGHVLIKTQDTTEPSFIKE